MDEARSAKHMATFKPILPRFGQLWPIMVWPGLAVFRFCQCTCRPTCFGFVSAERWCLVFHSVSPCLVYTNIRGLIPMEWDAHDDKSISVGHSGYFRCQKSIFSSFYNKFLVISIKQQFKSYKQVKQINPFNWRWTDNKLYQNDIVFP